MVTDEALASYDMAIALKSDYAGAFNNRGRALQELTRLDEALASYDTALALKPDYTEALNNRGNTLQELQQLDEALASYDKALALKPDYAEALNNRGKALQALQRLDEALTSYDRALAVRPDYAEALSNRGWTLHELRRLDEALASYDRALTVRPDYAEAHYDEALCRLLIGDFDRGWEKNEWRWETGQARNRKRNFAQLQWIGSNEVAGKTVLLHAEQGFGDTIQFCRYVPLVARRAARVVLEVQRPLYELMSTLPGAAQIVVSGEPLPDFDIHCPLLSLPLAFGTRLETIPSETPYLSAPEGKTSAWRDRLGKHEKLRVGLVWAGNPRKQLPHANRIDRQRSIAFDRLAPLFQVTECQFYSLQKGDDAVTQLRHSALHQHVIDWTEDLHDFSDTAALIENLDVIIAVDTSVAHLAGALGKPIWLVNRYNTCWRWLLDRDDSPWYPTLRQFRQPSPGDWISVISGVQDALQRLAAGDRDQLRP
ncbi:MAG: tetratricopeptide repeat-containing glycosyltransferase family protein, partial [Steroidobacteraceae bacterium]